MADELDAQAAAELDTHITTAELEAPLPESATVDEAIELYLDDRCSLGRAAELADVTRWDIMDVLAERGTPVTIESHSSIEEVDAFADELEARAAAKELELNAAL